LKETGVEVINRSVSIIQVMRRLVYEQMQGVPGTGRYVKGQGVADRKQTIPVLDCPRSLYLFACLAVVLVVLLVF
jgi:hypothetical protein